MKKFFLLLFIAVALSSACMAQSQESELPRPSNTYYMMQGDQAINLSVGFLNKTDFAFGLFESTGSGNPSPSLNLSYEYGLLNNVRITGFASYYRVESSGNYNLNSIVDGLGQIDGSNIDVNSILDNLDCIFNPLSCLTTTTTVEERISVYTIGGKLSISRPFIDGIDTYGSTYLGYSFNRRKTITEEALDVAIDELGLDTEIPTLIYYINAGARYFVTPEIGVFGEYGLGNVHLLKVGLSYKLK